MISKNANMKKINFCLLTGILVFVSCQKDQSSPTATASAPSQNVSSALSPESKPVTAVNFPKEVIDVKGGRIEFWAKLIGYHGAITVGGYDPHFFQAYDGTSCWQMGFNANDGAGNSGCVGVSGYEFYCGSGGATYENVFGAGNVDKWHYYVLVWDKDGVPCLRDSTKKIAIYIDGKLRTISWHAILGQKFIPLTSGVFNLITTAGPKIAVPGQVIMDELKIYDKHNQIILWNTLGSVDEVTHSKVGLNGSFNGGGNASFVPGKSGNALIAEPVGGL